MEHKRGQGAEFKRGEINLGILVRDIGGSKRFRTAEFDIKGHPELTELSLSYADSLYGLCEGLKIGIWSKKFKSGKYQQVSSNCVKVIYDYTSDYRPSFDGREVC